MSPIDNTWKLSRNAINKLQAIFMVRTLEKEQNGHIKLLEESFFTSVGLAEDYVRHNAAIEASKQFVQEPELGNAPDGSGVTYVGMKAWKIYVLDGLEAHLELPISSYESDVNPYNNLMENSFSCIGTAGEAVDAFHKLGATLYSFQDRIVHGRKAFSFKFIDASGFEGDVLVVNEEISISYYEEN